MFGGLIKAVLTNEGIYQRGVMLMTLAKGVDDEVELKGRMIRHFICMRII